ncbi:hypothetical protein D3C85_777230 [compost metagenome]
MKGPVGASSDWVVMIRSTLSGFEIWPPRSWVMTFPAPFMAPIRWSSSSRTKTGLEPVTTFVSKVLIFSFALFFRSVIVLMWSWTWKRACSTPSSSASIIPAHCSKARSATSWVGPTKISCARGRLFISRAVSAIAAPPVVFEFFFGTMQKTSGTIRRPSCIDPKIALTMSLCQSPAASPKVG